MIRTLIALILSATSIASAHASARSASPVPLKLSCKVEMLGLEGKPETVTGESEPFQLSKLPTEKASVRLKFGDYQLDGEMQLQGKSEWLIKPTLEMNIHQGDPVRTSIFRAAITGLQIEDRKAKEPLELHGFQFREFQYKDTKMTRMDYSCELARLK